MPAALISIVQAFIWLITTITAFFKGTAAVAFFTYVFSSLAFKVISSLGIGYVTFDLTTEFLDYGKQLITSEFASLNSFQHGYLIIDLINSLRLTEAVSIVFSAITIAFTLKSYKWAITAFTKS